MGGQFRFLIERTVGCQKINLSELISLTNFFLHYALIQLGATL
jgi:hypothetical protein